MDKYFLITLQEILDLITGKLNNLEVCIKYAKDTKDWIAVDTTIDHLKDIINVTYILVQRRK